ncbi:hypothetical protein BV210_01955 [Halorientalis sp. IM1011]|uniref:hypothetical protein n=1 Tax=Halorientalis sp. IM1011 TaxID=1932360 RepID=UPI00097CCE7F|nr:hypothetical protein [Halorientalis sp. IM1011]AQL41552.1 hypothetical protein BV210_01955 [Halorientalis sp. IM1011]
MFGQGNQTYQTVVDLLHAWRPSQDYGHESKFQKELADFLEVELNEHSDGMMGGMLGGGGGDNYVVSRERGNARGDVVVNDTVGIEMKRHFSNDQKRKLRGQLEDYADNYPYVIALACGIDDMDGWREVENKFAQGRGMGMEQTEFTFLVKRRENFGEEHDFGGGFDGGIPGI